MLVKLIMRVLKNLFGNNTKISSGEVAIKDGKGKGVTLDNYININYLDNQEIPTNEFINGKRIYAKRIIVGSLSVGVKKVPHNIPFYEEAWIDLSNSYIIASSKVSYPLIVIMYESESNNEKIQVALDTNNVKVITNSGWGIWSVKLVIKYTKGE